MLFQLATRVIRTTHPRLLWKFCYNFGFKGMLSVERFKRRIKRGEYFPPFLYISIINSCNLRCQGCWVDVEAPRKMIELEDCNRLINEAKKQGNSFFGILGGEPFMHPQLMEILGAHPDCYFQVFTNGQFITEKIARQLKQLGNVTPLVSIEGREFVSDARRGKTQVFERTLKGLQNCLKAGLLTGVATSLCQSNFRELLTQSWLQELIDYGVHYVWYHSYRPVGPKMTAELALNPAQIIEARKFVVNMRAKMPIGMIDAYYDDKGEALCPMATGISHHIGPAGDIEPCPIIQFATDNIRSGNIFETMKNSAFLSDFRKAASENTRGCIVLERPDLIKELALKHGARDTTQRGTAMAELAAMKARPSQDRRGEEIPEVHWMYRIAKKYWFNDFGAYSSLDHQTRRTPPVQPVILEPERN